MAKTRKSPRNAFSSPVAIRPRTSASCAAAQCDWLAMPFRRPLRYVVDAREESTRRFAAAVRAAAPAWADARPQAFNAAQAMLDSIELDGVFDLTPAPAHGAVNGTILEIHGTAGVVSFGGHSWERDAPVYLHLDDGGDAAADGEDGRPVPNVPEDEHGTVGAGAIHFIRVLLGEEAPVLTAQHALHVLHVILKAYESIADGRAHATETTF